MQHMNSERLRYLATLAHHSPKVDDQYRAVRGVFSRWCAWRYKAAKTDTERMQIRVCARAAFSEFWARLDIQGGRYVGDFSVCDRHLAEIQSV